MQNGTYLNQKCSSYHDFIVIVLTTLCDKLRCVLSWMNSMEVFRLVAKLWAPHRIKRSVISLLLLIALTYIWVLYSAVSELAGSRPGQQVLGKAPFDAQRAMEKFCTGIIATLQGVWLVGYRDIYPDEMPDEILQGAIYLHALLPSGSEHARGVSLISRLEDGVFRALAFISGHACLVSSPDGKDVFLLTGIDLPYDEERPHDQTAVFRTNDQGKTWQPLLKDGFMAKADSHAQTLKPYFYDNNEVWAWGGGHEPKKLFYSPNQGIHVEAIESSEELCIGELPDHTIKAHVVQLDAQQAKIWVSQKYWNASQLYWNGNQPNTITREAQLTRKEGRWELGEVRSTRGLFIHELKENGSGRIVAVLSRDDDFNKNELAELAADGHSWEKRSTPPNLFWPFPAKSSIETERFFVKENTVLATMSSEHTVPRWLYPWGKDPARISADAVLSSKNGGKTWTKLAIPGYIGVLGFDAQKKQVYWNKGNWYENNDPNIYSHDLSR